LAESRTFAYRGRDTSGKIVKGKVDGTSEAAATNRLRVMGISPIALSESRGTGLNRDLTIPGFEKPVNAKDLAIMSRQMSTMVSSGLSLLRTLTILSEQSESAPLRRTLSSVRTYVESGGSFSDALSKYPKVFPPLMINLVRAGETGGFLDGALLSIAENYENDVKLRGTIKAALTYPVVVLMMAIVAVAAMLIFIVPIFEKMFSDLGGELPLPTQMLVTLSKQMVWLGPLLLVLGVAFWFWWRSNKHTEAVRKVVDPLRLKLPVFGPLFAKVTIARFSRNFASMMGAGVPILQSLSIVGETAGNYVIEKGLQTVADSVRSGKSLAAPLALIPVFPPMVVQMISVGEDSGSLEIMLTKIAEFYDQEVQATAEQLTSLIEPLMIAFIGAVIGSMVIAMYLPMFTIFEQIN
jgi:type IV pilus assembly protein PilC